MPERKPVKRNGTCLATSNQCCHFSCQPTPSKLTMMNCGGFSPGCSFFGTYPSASAAPSCGAAFGSAGALLEAGAEELAAGEVPTADSDGLGLAAAGSELAAADDAGPAVTKLVTVWLPTWPPVLHADNKASAATAMASFRPRPTRIESSPNTLQNRFVRTQRWPTRHKNLSLLSTIGCAITVN